MDDRYICSPTTPRVMLRIKPSIVGMTLAIILGVEWSGVLVRDCSDYDITQVFLEPIFVVHGDEAL
ncbi:MAG TPA: hypothetical protein DCL75_16940 [Ktedonobacter sp.]|jgi:hypothetical protein|nr:hypothetical protein [Ktedonobacter sp.]HCF83599.1 hypothetical protein [Ktedonobacter sp.]HCJ35569.1 hypothetical protein [Ktedonobacter sp.]HCP74474.1 hypothetical protein [Ktedonobacter sp.]